MSSDTRDMHAIYFEIALLEVEVTLPEVRNCPGESNILSS